jgi:hypothetical protein
MTHQRRTSLLTKDRQSTSSIGSAFPRLADISMVDPAANAMKDAEIEERAGAAIFTVKAMSGPAFRALIRDGAIYPRMVRI